jgi:hypothetical protein
MIAMMASIARHLPLVSVRRVIVKYIESLNDEYQFRYVLQFKGRISHHGSGIYHGYCQCRRDVAINFAILLFDVTHRRR